jgi:hypothetical protein
MRLFSRIIILLIISEFIFSCKNKDGGNETKHNLSSSGGLRMMPYVEHSLVGNSRQQLLLQNVGKCIGLHRMPSGLANLNIRIWLWDSEKSFVVDLLDSGIVKRCYIAEITSETANGQEQLAIHREWTDLIPASGWDSLFSNVERYGITKLEGGKPSQQIISKPTQGAYVQFEIARPSGYHFFEYYQPDFYRAVDPDSRKVYKFLKYLNSQFGVTAYKGVDENSNFKSSHY